MMGANAAQHPGIKVLDALLGIEHHSSVYCIREVYLRNEY